MAEKMSNIDRAKQFLPFNSLRGFYDLVRKKEKIIIPKKTLSCDEIEKLSFGYNQLKVGKMVKIKYYENNGYVEFEGMIANIDNIYKTITLVTTKINLDDIIEISADWLIPFETD